MKLIDLLVKKTNEEGWEWPGKSTFCYQTKPEHGYITKFFDRNGVKVVDYCWEKCDDASVFNELTKEQYDSAIAASGGWIEWGGGECPVKSDSIVGVRFRSGEEVKAIQAYHWHWKHDGSHSDIIAYRLHKPEINSLANDDRLEQDLNECIGQDVDMPEWSGDGVPPIGCACEMKDSKGAWLPVEIIAKNDVFTFGWSYDYRIVIFGDKADEFRPLRTEEEKAREIAVEAITKSAGVFAVKSVSEKLYDEIAAGKIPGVKLEVK